MPDGSLLLPATGTLEAVTTVDVGTQVSGVVQDLYADFNSLVKRGAIIARLDPSNINTQIAQARANREQVAFDGEVRIVLFSRAARNGSSPSRPTYGSTAVTSTT